jgi:outer membrane immunogenic protein
MRRFVYTFLLGAALTVGVIGTGFAADLAVNEVPVAATPPVAVPYSWTGIYTGLNLGYAWGNTHNKVYPLPSPASFGAAPFTVDESPEGVLGGIQLGYNYQWRRFVAGLETDFQGSDIDDTGRLSPLMRNPTTPVVGWNSEARTELDYFGTLRGRVGFTAIPELLLYVTGGFAYGRVENASFTTFTPAAPFMYTGVARELEPGWTVGAGVEYGLDSLSIRKYGLSRWSIKLEYLYVSLDSPDYTANPLVSNPPFALRHTLDDFAMSIARVGINYRFFQ